MENQTDTLRNSRQRSCWRCSEKSRPSSPVMISRWEAEFLDHASTVFEKKVSEVDKVRKEYEAKQERLEKLVGHLTVEVDW